MNQVHIVSLLFSFFHGSAGQHIFLKADLHIFLLKTENNSDFCGLN
jgi:hypothetical protein